MKKSEVKTGQTYRVKVSDSIADVRITGENPHGGWDGVNLATKRKVRIKSAQRLRKRVAVAAPVANKPEKATKDAKAAKERDTGERRAPGGERNAKPMSLLDAAAHILSLGAALPMRCKDIVDLAVARKLWTPGVGKTPANTLYASITREIKTKGDASRFRKAERGKFALAK